MENSIGVGLIVGLTLASSIYVWSNEKFSSVQKTILLICIVFPPAQWLGILIVLANNSSVENNTPEKKTEKKLDLTISNLTELKEKGILTEEEYKNKVQKIEVEKIEQDLKNSLEYKQLKSLLDSGVLTKEEFESKVQLLQNISIKEVDTKEISKKSDLENIPHIDSIEERDDEKKQNLTSIYLLLVFAVILSIGGIILFSYSNNNNSEDIYVPPAIDTSAVYNTDYQEPLKIKKFVYVEFKVKTPKLLTIETGGSKDYSTNLYTPLERFCYIDWEKLSFTSEILEIEDYTEDNKNRTLDQLESKMYDKLKIYDYNYSVDVRYNCKDESKKDSLLQAKSEIIDRIIYDFNTYSEASISKRQ